MNYDLEHRTFEFASRVRKWIRGLKMDVVYYEDAKQLVRSSGSVGANYIEANEALSRKDFIHRIKICKKESKESKYWLRLMAHGHQQESENERQKLIDESTEFIRIFAAIIKSSKE